jgi:hypothetical protein
MNYSSHSKWIWKMLELIAKDEKARRFAYTVVSIGLIYAFSSLVTSIRWW